MLLDDFGKICVFKEKNRTPDGEGGYYIEWADGAEFTAYQSLDTSMEARTAEKQGVTSVYSVIQPVEYLEIPDSGCRKDLPHRTQ